MDTKQGACPDCDAGLGRREFLKAVSAAAVGAGLPLWATPRAPAAATPKSVAETAVKGLYDSLTEEQRKAICFAWDHQDKDRGLLRTFVSNNWQITPHRVRSDFFSLKQQDVIHDVWKGLVNPEWYGKFMRQLRDDTGGKLWGSEQSVAIFGKPGDGKFEFVMTGRHMTVRADGNTESHVAFGGPIFYGHQATQVRGLLEQDGHPGNVFWHQAVMANKVYTMLEPPQRQKAVVDKTPEEAAVGFRGAKGGFPGIPVKELAEEQKKELQKVLLALVEPYRAEDQEEALACLKKHGGLDGCGLAFYSDEDHGKDGVWDNWRLEGPAFVWYFRGNPHVHVWVHIADDPSVSLNARG